MTMADTALEFDRPEVNVDLAKQYLKDNADNIKNKELKAEEKHGWDFDPRKREILAEKIRENSKLICQLEYMTNNTPIEDSEKNVQLLLHYVSLPKRYRATMTKDSVSIFKTTPLALIMHAIEMGELNVCEERSAVCHLILKLCEETGLFGSTFKVDTSLGETEDLFDTPTCTGIVSEKSDLDSAVDAFLSSSSSSYCFWRVRQIFVQESVFQSFKELIEFKVKLKGTEVKELEELKNLSSDLFVYDNKVFLFDYAGDVDALRLDGAHIIFIEAYRTNKELLTLVREKKKTGCVSLWCADVAEANEIAYSVPASLVWVNDYGNFDGPPEIATFYYTSYQSGEGDAPKSITDCYETWKKYDNKKRASIIYDVFAKVKDACSLSKEGEETKSEMLKLMEQTSNLKFNVVNVADGKICVVLDSPIGFSYDESYGFDANVLGSLVVGNGIVCSNLKGPTDDSESLHLNLHRAGVPIWDIAELSEDEKNLRIHSFRYRTKVVITNFGTIFAN